MEIRANVTRVSSRCLHLSLWGGETNVTYHRFAILDAAVFDGHAGNQASEWLRGNLCTRLDALLNASGREALNHAIATNQGDWDITNVPIEVRALYIYIHLCFFSFASKSLASSWIIVAYFPLFCSSGVPWRQHFRPLTGNYKSI